MHRLRHILSLFCLISLLISCRTELPKQADLDVINIRLQRDPLRLNPVFNPPSSSREVFQYLYLPLADFHFETKALYPILIEALPTGEIITEGEKKGQIAFDFKIKADAEWYDGTPITSKDYLFTMKSILVPNSNTVVWRTLVSEILDIQTYEADPKRVTVYMDADFMLARESALTMELLPAHIHDPKGILASYTFDQIVNQADQLETDSSIIAFADYFNSPVLSRDSVNNSGPYLLESWVTNQSIVLKRKVDYWGKNYPDNPFFSAGANRLVFKIIPDENNALTALKNKELDVMTFRSSNNFAALQKDKLYNQDFKFLSANTLSYYYIALNNKSPKLEDARVRTALSHLMNVDIVIDTIDHGFGTRTIGHFNPERSYYADDIAPIPFDIEGAKRLLDQAGWKDSNANGIRDKNINGKLTELNLEFLISGSHLTENIGILMKDAARKAGVEINLVRKKGSIVRKEHIATRDFEMLTYSVNQALAPDDPYSRFHTDSQADGGNNFVGYSNPEADKLMEQIRDERDVGKRDKLYKELQGIMFDDQPLIFLYTPQSKIVVNKDFDAQASPKRPGYFANTFKSKVKS